ERPAFFAEAPALTRGREGPLGDPRGDHLGNVLGISSEAEPEGAGRLPEGVLLVVKDDAKLPVTSQHLGALVATTCRNYLGQPGAQGLAAIGLTRQALDEPIEVGGPPSTARFAVVACSGL